MSSLQISRIPEEVRYIKYKVKQITRRVIMGLRGRIAPDDECKDKNMIITVHDSDNNGEK